MHQVAYRNCYRCQQQINTVENEINRAIDFRSNLPIEKIQPSLSVWVPFETI